MRTVPTLAASGAGISLSAVGLALARPVDDQHSSSRPTTTGQRPSTMTAVAAYNGSLPYERNSPLIQSISTPRSVSLSSGTRPIPGTKERRSTLTSSGSRKGRDIGTPRSSSAVDNSKRLLKKLPQRETEVDNGTTSQAGPLNSRPRSWLRRLSSSVNSSRDSSITPESLSSSRPSSRPVSMVASKTNSWPAGSHQDLDQSSAVKPPNRLVKRATSLGNSTASPLQSSPGSRLPVPVFKRPATSHQRSAAAPKCWSDIGPGQTESQLHQYFTPRVAHESAMLGRRLSGIPNPIRRVYPDRKYTPMLVSAGEPLKQARVEIDEGISDDEEDVHDGMERLSASVASSPVPVQPAFFDKSQTARRSFSIGDLLSTGPSQPSWSRESNNIKRRSASGRLSRAERSRVVSAPSMGSSISSNVGLTDSVRPTKRRSIVGPAATTPRSIDSSSSSFLAPVASHNDDNENIGSSPIVSFPAYSELTKVETPTRSLAPSLFEPHLHASAATDASTPRIPSTVGSDSERRSLGGFSTDYQSDTVWDSLPARTTRSSSGKRGPPIDTIFDESPPPTLSSGRSTRLRDFLGENNILNSGHSSKYRHSTIEEEGSLVSTPVRSLRDKSVNSTPSARQGSGPLFLSSPPMRPIMPEPNDIDWDAPDENNIPTSGLGIDGKNSMQPPVLLKGKVGLFAFQDDSPADTPGGQARADRTNLFDWAEQQPSPSHGEHSPPRPKTVHGKKDPDARGSRAAGRRAPSGMHARSHSVPVVPDVDGKRTNVVANKFGTWGVGTKAVTEDWNEDFDFDDLATGTDTIQLDDKRIDSGHEMFVPPSIRQQQENVVAHIGLLREWGLLIEELKELRIRAIQLDMLSGSYAQTLHEIDGMIELADQESDETTLEVSRSPPSSPPGFETDVKDGPITRTNKLSAALLDTVARPRKDSEAVARSVIEALQAKRAVSDPLDKSSSPNKKVPFDTATLRHIVPYVNGLKRKIKDGLRETEGLYYSPRRRSTSPEGLEPCTPTAGTPTFSDIFNGPTNGSPSRRRPTNRRLEAKTDNIEPAVDIDETMQQMHL